ncbi:adenylate/guanylate cyclase domain-containing protein [Pseudohongiella sp.]|uniref:Guanylate cyclase domain-containing protein n=1 Tax=marine sediment metagenome TaxID=412755 RepID=A0A0F9W3S5_9ZZZZ|nr:adenylate/guanylate cyclase domain-containing protein [Pseudohongiella sp.]HDZ08533.1 HAMP domain-containing protein [Pseudohongiella sp.]HEA61729.1 HAMP domain-containing protein [Pseudohongiella sp.]
MTTKARSQFKFSSIRTRLIVFLLLMLLPVLSAIYWFVDRENTRYTDETINSYLDIGADVFDFSREEHKNTLLTISNALTRDWGFRNAFGASDAQTITDAAQTLLVRSFGAADVMIITDMSGRIIVDTSEPGLEALPPAWVDMINSAASTGDGVADDILTLNDIPYQMTVIPLFLPTPVAWIIAGFPLDDDFANSIKSSTASEVSIVKYLHQADGAPVQKQVIASTLSAADAANLAHGLDAGIYSETQRITMTDADYGTLVRSLTGRTEQGEEIVAVIQRSYEENQANLAALRDRLFDFSLAVVVLSLLAVIVLARGFTRPVLRLASRVQRIEGGDYSSALPQEQVWGRDEVAGLADSIDNMASGLAEKEKVRDLLGKVVSREIADELLNSRIELGGEEKVVSVLFADIRGFTALSEQQSPSQTLAMLNTCLESICSAIEAHGGVVDKFTGDAVMALFGAPIGHQDDAMRAARALLAVQDAMAGVNQQLRSDVGNEQPGLQLRLGAGLHTGLVVAGNMGSRNRMNYTVIGDAVNLASRLEGLTRHYNVHNVISEASRRALGEQAQTFAWRELDLVRVKGKQEPVRIYELVGRRDQLDAQTLAELTRFEEVLTLYRSRQWDAALGILRALSEANPLTLYELYSARISELRDTVSADWDGVYVFSSK